MRTWLVILAFAVGVFISACGGGGRETYEVEVTDVKSAKSAIDLLSDDKLEDKKPVFDANLVDSRPFGPVGHQWQFNTSAAVIGLDIEDIGNEAGFDKLYPHYAAAAEAFSAKNVLPSVNMIDGKAKQFDDGLYAAMERRMVLGAGLEASVNPSKLDYMIRSLYRRADEGSECRDWLAAAVMLVYGEGAEGAGVTLTARAKNLVAAFESNEALSKPIGFYTWSKQLQACFKFLRFLQQGFDDRKGVPDQVIAALRKYESAVQTKGAYERVLSTYASLTNPFAALTFLDLMRYPDKSVAEIWKLKGMPTGGTPMAHFLPPSTSPDGELFDRLFPEGLPDGADLMLEFIKAIRSGKIDLKPRAHSGWYDYQVYALETFLLPERGAENSKLLLSKKYKARMLEAFKSMITKRRETHVRGIGMAGNTAAGAEPPDGEISPRLRVEPNPTFYLRTARAYAFLWSFLKDWLAEKPTPMSSAVEYGLREQGERKVLLRNELKWMIQLFYGLYLVSCEDIGMKPETLEDELVFWPGAKDIALEWLEGPEGSMKPRPDDKRVTPEEIRIDSDDDLAVDTRVAVPIYFDTTPGKEKTRCWGTLGVRPVKLRVWYATPPKWRPMENNAGKGEWEEVPSHRLADAHYIILTDEFGEFTLKGNRVLNRAEFRDFCDKGKTKQGIIAALQK